MALLDTAVAHSGQGLSDIAAMKGWLRPNAHVQLQGAFQVRDLEAALPDAWAQPNDSSGRPCLLQHVVRPLQCQELRTARQSIL
jgi:hypothetical protein